MSMAWLVALAAIAMAGCGCSPSDPPGLETRAASAPGPFEPEGGKVVVLQRDEDEIRQLLERFRAHTSSLEVSDSSSNGPYLDCDAHRKLVAFGLRAAPYLVEQAGKLQHVDVLLGSQAIGDPNVTTPEQVYEFNKTRQRKATDATLPSFVLASVLDEVAPLEDAPSGSRHTDCFAWIRWWEQSQDQFVFKTRSPPRIPPPEPVSYAPHTTTRSRDGLLDIHAVSSTYRHIFERAAAEAGVEVFVGEHDDLHIIATIRMKGVTFDELVYLLDREISFAPLSYRTATGYHIGGKNPALPRVYMKGWGVMMERTVFSTGDEIQVTVAPTLIGPPVDLSDPRLLSKSAFRITDNEGRLVELCRPALRQPERGDQIQKSLLFSARGVCGPGARITCTPLILSKTCQLPPGEYNLAFTHAGEHSPTVAFEIYEPSAAAASEE